MTSHGKPIGWLLLLLTLWGLALPLGCTQHAARPVPPALVGAPRRVGLPLVQLLTPNTPAVLPLVASLRREVAADLDLQVVLIGEQTQESFVRNLLVQELPAAVVLVDNSSALLYAHAIQDLAAPPPAIIVMASFVEQLQAQIPNSTGIAFEPPAVTSLSDMRSVMGRPLTRVGVVYRRGFEAFIDQERSRAAQEKIELVTVQVASRPTLSSLTRALRSLEREDLDAVWVSNDNVLLTRRLLTRAWLPFARKSKLPIVVGVPALVQPAVHFGLYAAVPDAAALGVQTADVLFSLLEHDFKHQGPAIQPPFALKTYLDLEQARGLGLAPGGEARVDVLVGRTDPK
jgi:ABC-type uncharacterized transport system substrate-binding protein